MITFQQIKVTRIKLGTVVKRIYSGSDEREASAFAHKWGGIHFQYLPDLWRVIIN